MKVSRGEYWTAGGERAVVLICWKPRMSVFVMFGFLADKPCHWTSDGKYRMDGKSDPRDLVSIRC